MKKPLARFNRIPSELTLLRSSCGSKMAKRVIPSLNRILMEKIVTNARIFLLEKTPKLNSGKVVVGIGARDRDVKTVDAPFKEGDAFLLQEYGGTEVQLADK